MRNNQPVTDREVLVTEGCVLITKTDMKGKITYANEEFINISGFSSSELLGSDHNIVRHPDMPSEAFADLWATVKQGKPWRQLVKNRTKTGDYYWIEANVTPLYQNGRPEGYLSVRYCPAREQVRVAEELYEKIRRTKAPLRSVGLLDKINLLKKLSVKSKLMFAAIFFLIPTILSTTLLIKEKNNVIDFAAQELVGVDYHKAITQLLIHVGEYSNLTAQSLKNAATDDPSLLQMQKTIEADLVVLDAADVKYGGELKSTLSWQAIKQNWQGLLATGSPSSGEELFARQSALIESIYSLIGDIDDSSNLILDPDLDSFWLMDMAEVKLPELVERLVFLRGYISLNYTGEALSDKQKIDLMLKYRLAQRLFDKVSQSAAKTARYNAAVATALNNEKPRLEAVIQRYLTTVQATLIENKTAALPADQYFSAGGEAIHVAASLYDVGSVNLKQLLEARVNKMDGEKYRQLAIVMVLALIALFIGLWVSNYIILNVKNINRIFFRLTDGDFKNYVDLDVPDEFGDILRGLQGLQVKLFFDLNDAKDQAKNSLRIQNALDNVQSCVMVADNNLDIIYMNKTVLAMFQNAQADIRQQIPNFDADSLMGANIDQFHQNPAHQRGLLANLSSTFRSSMTIGGRHLNIVANPVKNADGVLLGSVVEWLDRTHEVKIEREIEAIVDAVKAGELSTRIALDDKHGFFKKLSEGINEVSNVIESVLKDIGDTMQSMSQGDLSNLIERDYQGVYLSCKNDINTTIDKMSEIFGQVSESAHIINNSSQEVASGNNNLSHRAEQQASSLEETAASMEELTGTVKHNADNALQANLLADNARELAENGGKVVQAAVAAMQDINESSNKISEIISVIDEIAFQTNLLALNASVEAARAGEQGRGFSVVATEVRNLAQRSATAAKESKELIQNSVQKVRVGAEYVNQTGKALGEIVAGVKKVGDIVAEIAAASVEQSAGIGQVNQAVAQMDEITQQNAALAEEASAASHSMSDLSISMVNLLSFFKTGSQQSAVQFTEKDTIVRAHTSTKPSPKAASPVSAIVASFKKGHVENLSIDDEWHDF